MGEDSERDGSYVKGHSSWAFKGRSQDPTQSTSVRELCATDQPAQPEEQGSPTSSTFEWFPEFQDEMDSQGGNTSHNDSEATKEPSYNESDFGESNYCSIKQEEVKPCVDNAPKDQVHNAVTAVEEAVPTESLTKPISQHTCRYGYLLQRLFIFFRIIVVTSCLLAPPANALSQAPGPAMTFPFLTYASFLTPGICNHSEDNSLLDTSVAHIARASLDMSTPLLHDTSIARVYIFEFDARKATLPQSKNDIASILLKVLLSPPLPPLDTPPRQPPSHISITSLALLVPTYESVRKNPVAAARARINWGNHPSCPVPAPLTDDCTSIMTCNISSHRDKQLNMSGAHVTVLFSAFDVNVTKGSTAAPLSICCSAVGCWYLLNYIHFLPFMYCPQLRLVSRKRSRQQKCSRKYLHKKGKRSHSSVTTDGSQHSTQDDTTDRNWQDIGHSRGSTPPDNHLSTNSQSGSQNSITHCNQPGIGLPHDNHQQGNTAPDSHPTARSHSAESPTPPHLMQGHSTLDHHSIKSLPTESRNPSTYETEASSNFTATTTTLSCSQTEPSLNHGSDDSTMVAASTAGDSQNPLLTVADRIMIFLLPIWTHLISWKKRKRDDSDATKGERESNPGSHLFVQNPTMDASLEQNQMELDNCPTVQDEDSDTSGQWHSQCSVERPSPSGTPQPVQDYIDHSNNSASSGVHLDNNGNYITSLSEEKVLRSPTTKPPITSQTEQFCEYSTSGSDNSTSGSDNSTSGSDNSIFGSDNSTSGSDNSTDWPGSETNQRPPLIQSLPPFSPSPQTQTLTPLPSSPSKLAAAGLKQHSSTTAMNICPKQVTMTQLVEAGVKHPCLQDTFSGHPFENNHHESSQPISKLASAEMEVTSQSLTMGQGYVTDEVKGGEIEGRSCGEERYLQWKEEREMKRWKEEERTERGREGNIEGCQEDERMDGLSEESLHTTLAHVEVAYSDRHQEPLTTARKKEQGWLAHSMYKEHCKARQRLTTNDAHENDNPSLSVEQDQLGTDLVVSVQETHVTQSLTTPTNNCDDMVLTLKATTMSQQTGLRSQVTEHPEERNPKPSSGIANAGPLVGIADSLPQLPQHLAPVKHPPDCSVDQPCLPPTDATVQEHKSNRHPAISINPVKRGHERGGTQTKHTLLLTTPKSPEFNRKTQVVKTKRHELEQTSKTNESKQGEQGSVRHRTEERKRKCTDDDGDMHCESESPLIPIVSKPYCPTGEIQSGEHWKSSMQRNDTVSTYTSSRDQQQHNSVNSKAEQSSPQGREVSEEEESRCGDGGGQSSIVHVERGDPHTGTRELQNNKPTAMVMKKEGCLMCAISPPPGSRDKENIQATSKVKTSLVTFSSKLMEHLPHPRKCPHHDLCSNSWPTADDEPELKRPVCRDKRWVTMQDSEPEESNRIFDEKNRTSPIQHTNKSCKISAPFKICAPQTFSTTSNDKARSRRNSAFRPPGGTLMGSSRIQHSSTRESDGFGEGKSGSKVSGSCEHMPSCGDAGRSGRDPSEKREPVNSKEKSIVKVKKKAKEEGRTWIEEEEEKTDHQKSEKREELSRGHGSSKSDGETCTCTYRTQLKTFPSPAGGEDSSSLVCEDNEYETQPVQETCGHWHEAPLHNVNDSLLTNEATLTDQEHGEHRDHESPVVTGSTKCRVQTKDVDSAIEERVSSFQPQPVIVTTSTNDSCHHEVAVEQSTEQKDATSGLLVGLSFYSHNNPVPSSPTLFKDQTKPFPGLFEVVSQELCCEGSACDEEKEEEEGKEDGNGFGSAKPEK